MIEMAERVMRNKRIKMCKGVTIPRKRLLGKERKS
jgi:hypothetical protein